MTDTPKKNEEKCARCAVPLSACSKKRWDEPVCRANGTTYDAHAVDYPEHLEALKAKDIEAGEMVREAQKVTENTSDGYHTFKELYEFRMLYNAVLFNEWFASGKYSVHKSERHGDGELCFGGGWFIVMSTTPHGQISNHYEMKDWDLFKCEAREKADVWDGHTSQDIVVRLRAITNSSEGQTKQ